MKKILIFGVTGEIGGRIARLAVDAGHNVTGVSRGQNKRAMVDLSGVTILSGDKTDEVFLKNVCSKLDIEVVIDSVPRQGDDERYFKYFKKAKNFLFCSSTGTFVPLQYIPADENHPWREKTPVNFWYQCVRDAHNLELWKNKKFPITIMRPTNIIGEHRIPLDLWGGRDIDFFKKLKAGEPVTIAPCENILLQSGYNWDLASAFVKALEHPNSIRGQIFIISCKRAITLGSYLQTAMEFLKSKSEIRHSSPEKLEKIYPNIHVQGFEFLLEHMCFDISKAEKTFGYSPQKTAQEGLISALEWCESSKLL